MNGKIARNIERPRPLRPNSKTESGSTEGDVEGVHQLLLNVSSMLDSAEFGGSLPEAVAVLNKALKVHGAKLEKSFGSGLNQYMGSLMMSVKDTGLDMASKLHLLEIIELRKNKWVADSNIAEYYRQKLGLLEVRKYCTECTFLVSFVLKSVTKIPFQNSGLKRSASLNASAPEFAPSASSTPLGPTLRQSMSVDGGARDPQPMTIKVGGETIRIACNNEEMAKTCKKALDTYFADKSADSSSSSKSPETENVLAEGSKTADDDSAKDGTVNSATTAAKSLIIYDRDKLLELATSPHSMKAHGSVVEAFAAFPILKRRPDSTAKLPYVWSETFNEEASSAAVLACEDTNNNNYHKVSPNSASSSVSGLKKNFLDVLRPNAPRRVWDDNIGEWVEADTRG